MCVLTLCQDITTLVLRQIIVTIYSSTTTFLCPFCYFKFICYFRVQSIRDDSPLSLCFHRVYRISVLFGHAFHSLPNFKKETRYAIVSEVRRSIESCEIFPNQHSLHKPFKNACATKLSNVASKLVQLQVSQIGLAHRKILGRKLAT